MTTRTRLAATLLIAAAATTSACTSSPTSTSTSLPPTSATTTATTAPGTTTPATPVGEGTQQEAPATSAHTPATSDAAAPATTSRTSGRATTTPELAGADGPGDEDGEGVDSTPTTSGSAPTADAPEAEATPITSPAKASGPAVLGNRDVVPPSTRGYGATRPSEVSNGGDPTGTVTGITWDSWGGPVATGHGTSTYVEKGKSVSESGQARVTIRISGLRTCGGRPTYTHVTWWFPTKGESGPRESGSYFPYDIC